MTTLFIEDASFVPDDSLIPVSLKLNSCQVEVPVL